MALPVTGPCEWVPSRFAFDRNFLLGLSWKGKVMAAVFLGNDFGVGPRCGFQLCYFQVHDRTRMSWPPCPSVAPPVKRGAVTVPSSGGRRVGQVK